MTTLFLFAHQDDEIGALHEIASTLARGERALCVFLTDGAWEGVDPVIRNAESRRVLRSLGVPDEDIIFLGSAHGLPDGTLVEHLDRCREAVLQMLEVQPPVRRVIMHAYEGGHQDHDAGYLLGLAIARELGVLNQSRQLPFYREPAGRITLTLANPLPHNGTAELETIGWRERLRYLSLLRHYRSQAKVMLKLAPQLAWHYLTDGTQKLQPVSLASVQRAPNSKILYERWKLYTYERFREEAAGFIARHLSAEQRGEGAASRPSGSADKEHG